MYIGNKCTYVICMYVYFKFKYYFAVAKISFNTSTLTFREDFGVFELNLITDTVFQHDQIIHIKITDGTAESMEFYFTKTIWNAFNTLHKFAF